MLGRRSEDPALGCVFGPGPALFWFVMDQGFHTDGDEGERRVIMRAVEMCVVSNFRTCVALAEEEVLPFCLRDGLAPEAEEGVLDAPLRTAMKWSFENLMAFLAMLR